MTNPNQPAGRLTAEEDIAWLERQKRQAVAPGIDAYNARIDRLISMARALLTQPSDLDRSPGQDQPSAGPTSPFPANIDDVTTVAKALFETEHPGSVFAPGRARAIWFFRAEAAILAVRALSSPDETDGNSLGIDLNLEYLRRAAGVATEGMAPDPRVGELISAAKLAEDIIDDFLGAMSPGDEPDDEAGIALKAIRTSLAAFGDGR